jgi:NADPH:quinone reductase-like Zn-dependent oxidoreductase
MKAVTYRRYGPPSVLSVSSVPMPEPGAGQVLVRVHAASVTTADWRLRAAAFPGVMQVPGRLMFGLCGPRNPVLGSDFAGVVQAVAPDVTMFKPGDRVLGFGRSAHAEYLTIDQAGAVAHLPPTLSFEQGAALPFGGLAALVFLRDYGRVQPGQKVLVIGGSGGVGAYAVQIAQALGAQVTAVASASSQELLQQLGAAHQRDYRAEPSVQTGDAFDVILDTVGAVDFRTARRGLAANGVFLPLNFGLREMLQAMVSKQIRIGVNPDTRADLESLLAMIDMGTLRPVIDRAYPLEHAAQAHAYVQTRHRKGAVILTVS